MTTRNTGTGHARLKWKDDCAHTRFGRYMLNKCRIRNGKKLETEYEVCLDTKVIGISDNKTNGKVIAQMDFSVRNDKESQS